MVVEIERKWVADGRPDALAASLVGTRLRQGYLAEEGEVTVRVRITDEWAKLTIKAGSALTRTEVEVDVDRAEAEQLWPFTEGRRILKTRYRLPLDGASGLVAEVDVFAGDLEGLCLVEVEFPSEAAAAAFEPPDWFGRDVTSVKGWSNADLARRGRPDA